LEKKRADVDFDTILQPGLELPFSGEISHHSMAGLDVLNEVACFHKPSRTLMVCDLLMNLQLPLNGLSRLYFKLFAAVGKPAVSKTLKMMIKDRAQFKQSLDELLALDIERIVMGHGKVIEGDGARIMRDSFAWLR
jgi:hypothetical protein